MGSPSSAAEVEEAAAVWFDVGEWFVGHAHDPKDRLENGLADLLQHLQLFEAGLHTLRAGFFETKRELDDILEDANS
jgi:hypothetical protein